MSSLKERGLQTTSLQLISYHQNVYSKVSFHLCDGKLTTVGLREDITKVEIEGEEILTRLLTAFRLAEPEQSERYFQ